MVRPIHFPCYFAHFYVKSSQGRCGFSPGFTDLYNLVTGIIQNLKNILINGPPVSERRNLMKKNTSWEYREKILFAGSAGEFFSAAKKALDEINDASAAASVGLDLVSFLKEWKLRAFVKAGTLTEEQIDETADAFFDLTKKLGGEEAYQEAMKERTAILASEMKRLCEMTRDGKINTVWGHDYASGLTHSLRRGARWVTNNPCKNTLFKKDYPEIYEGILQEIHEQFPNADADEKVSQVFLKICSLSAAELRPIFEATGGDYGFVCIQTNPHNIDGPENTQLIIDQVEYWWEAFKKELGVEVPNVVFKIPAVKAGLEAAKVLIPKGYRLCATLDFTVTQHELFAREFSKGTQQSFVVLMGGLLDDKVGAELKELGVEDAVEVGRHAAQAVIRRSYANLKEKGLDRNVSIMTAAVRGPWAILNSVAPADGAPILITTLTNKINEFDGEPRDIVCRIDEPVDPGIMSVLKRSRVFCQAFGTPEEGTLDWDRDLYSFPPFMTFYDQFREAYDEILADVQK